MQRVCLDCGVPVKGRSDKNFCDDSCRNNYNNRLKAENMTFVRHVNVILKRNRSVLQKLNPEGKVKLTRDKLLKEGFNFSYHTHVYETFKGNIYHFCYEYGYLKLDKDEFLIVKRVDF